MELVGFGKTKLLAPEEGVRLTASAENAEYLKINFEQLRSYDSNGAQTYILGQGDYYLTVVFTCVTLVSAVMFVVGAVCDNRKMK